MIPPGLRNPFQTHKLDDTLVLPAGDVPALHAEVLARCGAALDQAVQGGQGVGLLVVGEAGSGKSHLIAQLRRQLANRPTVALATVPLRGAFAGRLWRHLREQLMTELLRSNRDQDPGANALLRVLRNRFPRWASAVQGETGGLLGWLVGRSRAEDDLQAHLDEFAGEGDLDYGLRKVLPRLGMSGTTALARSWLVGQQLGPEDLVKLGLPPAHPSEQEQEKNARDVVLSVLRLAGDRTALALCFDEVESIQAGTYDAGVLRQFATLATDLLAHAGPRAVITFVRPTLFVEMRRAVEVSNLQKAFRDQASIPPLSWEQAVQIARSRLDAEAGSRSARQQHPDDLDWPLGRRFLEDTFRAYRRVLTPRHLIMACRLEFDRLQRGKESGGGSGPGTGKTTTEAEHQRTDSPETGTSSNGFPPPDEFTRVWERQRKKHLGSLHGVAFDTVMGIGLPWLVGLNDLPYVRVEDQDSRLADVNLVFQPHGPGRRSVGVSFCSQQPRSLWRRLDRLLAQWEAARGKGLGALVIVRSDAEQTTGASQERLEALRRAGARVILVERQQLAEFAAFQGMLTAALGGDLTRNGNPVEPGEYDAWVKDHLSEAVKEFLHLVFEPPTTAPAPAFEPLPTAPTPAAVGRGKRAKPAAVKK
jgi:hypothetical protein